MRPRKTPSSTFVYELSGGNEDNSLFVEQATMGDVPVLISVWEPTEDERAVLAGGGTVELMVWGRSHPPVAMGVGPSISQRKENAGG
jgi:hypothetical protein